MKLTRIITLFTAAALLTLGYACQDDEGGSEPLDCTTERSYMGNVVPILNKSCAIEGCHVTDFPNGDYTTYEDLKAQHDLGLLQPQIESGIMPPSNSPGPTELTDAEKATILCWIEAGAQNN